MMQDISQLSPTVQNYLKAIYELSVEGSEANTSQIADMLNVSPASVTNMLQRLTAMQPPLIDYQKHRDVHLTQDGLLSALRLIRRHRLLELFLIEVMGYSWEEVHPEAEILEHAISAKLEERIDHLLGHPKFSPNGKPIPSASLEMPKTHMLPLADMHKGQKGSIAQINEHNPDILRYLEKNGLKPQAQVEVLENLPFDDTMCVRVSGNGEPVYLGPAIAGQIMVLPEEG